MPEKQEFLDFFCWDKLAYDSDGSERPMALYICQYTDYKHLKELIESRCDVHLQTNDTNTLSATQVFKLIRREIRVCNKIVTSNQILDDINAKGKEALGQPHKGTCAMFLDTLLRGLMYLAFDHNATMYSWKTVGMFHKHNWIIKDGKLIVWLPDLVKIDKKTLEITSPIDDTGKFDTRLFEEKREFFARKNKKKMREYYKDFWYKSRETLEKINKIIIPGKHPTASIFSKLVSLFREEQEWTLTEKEKKLIQQIVFEQIENSDLLLRYMAVCTGENLFYDSDFTEEENAEWQEEHWKTLKKSCAEYNAYISSSNSAADEDDDDDDDAAEDTTSSNGDDDDDDVAEETSSSTGNDDEVAEETSSSDNN